MSGKLLPYQALGETFQLAAMPELCPVVAYRNWLLAAELDKRKDGFVFRAFKPFGGGITERPLQSKSMSRWMTDLCMSAGLPDAEEYSSHSMRRGLANLLRDRGADVKILMDHIGWKSADTAIRYLGNGSRGTELLLS